MALGLLEIMLTVFMWSFFGLVHVVVYLSLQKGSQMMPKKILLIYGIPACCTIGCLVTPPDLISCLVIAIPSILVYVAICGVSILVIAFMSKTHLRTSGSNETSLSSRS